MRGFNTLLILGFFTMGCAANVDEPVQQLPEPAPQQEPAPVPFGGEIRFMDPVMQAIINQANEGNFGALPARQLPYEKPLESCPTCK
jgi:hypothetical protein